jgi:hypothetical protein
MLADFIRLRVVAQSRCGAGWQSQCHLVFLKLVHDVGRTPWSAADALVGLPLLHEPDFVSEGAGPGGPARTRGSAPLPMIKIPALGKLSDIGIASCHNPFESTVTTLALLPPA